MREALQNFETLVKNENPVTYGNPASTEPRRTRELMN